MKSAVLVLAALFVAAGPASAPAQQSTASKLPANLTWLDADPNNTLVVETTKGEIIAELYPQVAPITVERIKTLVKQKFYDGNEFFRVIESFMDQTGDPGNNGNGASMLPNIPPEFTFRRGPEVKETMFPSDKPNTGFIGIMPVSGQSNGMMALSVDGKAETGGLFCPGVLGMARADAPDSGNSQFFFMRNTSDALNGKYTAFGRVIQGMDAVRSIKSGEPVTPPRDKMTSVRLLADIPEAQRPKVKIMDTTTPAFAAYVDSVRTKVGGYFDLCDVDVTTPIS